jgi:hypothetical protein
MAPRYFSRIDNEGLFSIVDIFTGKCASFAGRELKRIPAKMIQSGLKIMNEIDDAERAVLNSSALGTLAH